MSDKIELKLPLQHYTAEDGQEMIGDVTGMALAKCVTKNEALAIIGAVNNSSPPTAALIDALTDAFLGWELPEDFMPDGGVDFPAPPIGMPWPVGTNLFTHTQAKAMFEYCLSPIEATKELSARCKQGFHWMVGKECHSCGYVAPIENGESNE